MYVRAEPANCKHSAAAVRRSPLVIPCPWLCDRGTGGSKSPQMNVSPADQCPVQWKVGLRVRRGMRVSHMYISTISPVSA